MKGLPPYVEKYLWDVKMEDLDIASHSIFVIERVLEYGDTRAFLWLLKTYTKENIINVLKESRRISPKTGNFYALYFGITKKELLCIRKPFIRKQDRF